MQGRLLAEALPAELIDHKRAAAHYEAAEKAKPGLAEVAIAHSELYSQRQEWDTARGFLKKAYSAAQDEESAKQIVNAVHNLELATVEALRQSAPDSARKAWLSAREIAEVELTPISSSVERWRQRANTAQETMQSKCHLGTVESWEPTKWDSHKICTVVHRKDGQSIQELVAEHRLGNESGPVLIKGAILTQMDCQNPDHLV